MKFRYSPAKMRPDHTNIVFLPGSSKYLRDSLTVTGAAKTPIAHSWKAPKTSISTAPKNGDVSYATLGKAEGLTVDVCCHEHNAMKRGDSRE